MTITSPLSQQTVMIIGGTSGVGLALAKVHHHLGWQVIVVGSKHSKIDALTAGKSQDIQAYQCDITNTAELTNLLSNFESIPFTRLIYCAGWYLNERVHQLDKANSLRMLAVNLQAFHTIFEWASQQLIMNAQKPNTHNNISPALVCLSSMAGVIDYPYASLYAKCKRAMIAIASAYRLGLAPFGIQVNCIAMGYVNTQTLRALNQGDASHKPFIIEEAEATKEIMQAISHNKELTIFPRKMRHLTHLLNSLPSPILNWMMRRQLDAS